MLPRDLDESLKLLVRQWNIAEQRIKKAEQTCENQVVTPAIFELRYAGRKIIDTIQLALSVDLNSDLKGYEAAKESLADAIEDCVKAKHDAIDTTMDFVTSWFANIERKIGLGKIQKFFPDYLEMTSRLVELQDRIAESRNDRNKLREAVYNDIERDDYDKILDLQKRMLTSQDRVQAQVYWDDVKDAILFILAVGGVVLGALTFIV